MSQKQLSCNLRRCRYECVLPSWETETLILRPHEWMNIMTAERTSLLHTFIPQKKKWLDINAWRADSSSTICCSVCLNLQPARLISGPLLHALTYTCMGCCKCKGRCLRNQIKNCGPKDKMSPWIDRWSTLLVSFRSSIVYTSPTPLIFRHAEPFLTSSKMF